MNNKKKILFLILGLPRGGAERVVVDQINLLDRNLFVPYLCLLNNNLKNDFLSEVALGDEYKKILPFRNLFDWQAWKRIITWIKQENFDVIYTHLFFANLVGRLAGKIVGIKKIIVVEHNVYLKRNFIERLTNKFLSLATNKIIAVSSSVKDYLVGVEKLNSQKIEVIYNGIDLDKYVFDKEKREKLRTFFGLSETDFVVLSVGRISKQKNYSLLLNIADELNNCNHESVYFFIAGDNSNFLGKQLSDNVRTMNLLNHVFFLGPRDDIADLLSFADVFLMTSDWEGLSIALIEAMATGLPVVVKNIPSLEEMTGLNNQFGLIAENKKDFVEKIIKLKKDVDSFEYYKQKSLDRSKDFSIENNVKKIENLFLDI
ncbi:MAG TPA: glycosyltransferase [Candidatus Magasanikbacteria bacterium]|nr:glycosyltransferase [Candidatus Magasanikbacteria bacterium]